MSKLDDEMNKAKLSLEIIIEEYTKTYYKVHMLHESIKANNIISQNNDAIRMSVRLLQDTLYSSAIIDLNTLFMDKDKDTISLEQIISKLKRPDFKAYILMHYIKIPRLIPINGHKQSDYWYEEYKNKKTDEFEERLQKIFNSYKKLQETPLYERVKKIRSKRIAHRDFRNYDIESNGHRFDEVEELLNFFKEILFEVNHILCKSTYILDDLETNYKKASQQFWALLEVKTSQ